MEGFPNENINIYVKVTELDNFIVAVNSAGDNIFKGEFTVAGDKDMPASGSGIYASAHPCPNNCPNASTDFA